MYKIYPHAFSELSHLYPPAEAFLVIHEGEKAKGKRKIFNKVEYTNYELEQIEKLKKLVAKAKIKLPNDWNDVNYMMYAQSTEFQLKLSVERIQKHIAWRNNIEYHNFFGKDDKALKILQDGLIYQFGRDKQFRPIIIYNLLSIREAINSKEITLQQFIRGMSYLLTAIRINMFLKYHIENWLIILDVQNMGALGLPIKMMNQIFEITYYGMTCTNDKLFIVNPSFSVNTVWKVVSAFDPATFSEIKFLQEPEFYKFLEFIPANQLEKKFGGEAENQTEFWPPKNTLPELEQIDLKELEKQEQQKQHLNQVNYNMKNFGCQQKDQKLEQESNLQQNIQVGGNNTNDKKEEEKCQIF